MQEEQRSAEVKKVRETMKNTMAARHRASVVDLTTDDADAETKKRKGDAPSKHAPAESKRRITDRIMAEMKQDGQEFITAVQEMETKKMDRLEQILTRALSGRSQSGAAQAGPSGAGSELETRVSGLETKVDGIKSSLDRLVLLMEEGPQ
jgi:hypothetical protein